MIPKEVQFEMLDLHEEVGQFFYITVDDISAVLRPLTYKEINSIEALRESLTSEFIDSWVVKKCCIYSSRDLQESKAGYVKVIAGEIYSKSVPDSVEAMSEELESYRAKPDGVQDMINTGIMQVIPAMRLSDVTNLPNSLRLKYLAKAETLMGAPIIDLAPKTRKKSRPDAPNYNDLLSREVADIPDFDADNNKINNL